MILRRLRRKNRKNRTARPLPSWVAWAVVAGIAIILIAGVGIGLANMAGRGHHASARQSSPAPTPSTHSSSLPADQNTRAHQDAIANQPMLEGDSTNADPSNFKPQPEVQAITAALTLPSGGKNESGVATGFPQTPEGAVAQLAALNMAAYSNLDVQAGRNAYTAFAMPGAVGLQDWNPTKTVMRFYTENDSKDPSRVHASFTPVQGLVKGHIGNDWALVCVNGQTSYSYNGDSNRVAVWDCARMQWEDGKKRWMLAPGPAPARAPLTWPRDELSYRAGFRDLTNTPS